MKKSIIEKMMLRNRLRKKMNENKASNEILLVNGRQSYSLNENELKSVIDEAVNNVLKRKGIKNLKESFNDDYYADDDEADIDNIYPKENDIDKKYDSEYKKEIINFWLKNLKPIERTVVKMKFGIGYDREYSDQEIADYLSVTKNTVNNIVEKSLDFLRKYGFADMFRNSSEENMSISK